MDDTENANTEKKDNASATVPDDHLRHVNEEIYKRNLELAFKNKTLSLLRRLYQISILTLKPKVLAEALGETMKTSLGAELVATLLYNKTNDTLVPLAVSHSELWATHLKEVGIELSTLTITRVSENSFIYPIIVEHVKGYTEHLTDIWKDESTSKAILALEQKVHAKTTMAYPLLIEGKVVGILLYSLTRNYEDLTPYEIESLESFSDVVAVALDRASLYEQLQTANEKLKGLDKLKTEFLSLASHQLRSPLTAIKGYTSMLSEGSFGPVTGEQKMAIDRVYESTEHLRKVVEDLLDVSKIEQGGMKFDMKEFNLSASVRDVIDTLAVTINEKGLEIIEEIPAEPITVTGDAEKLRQVFINLVDNCLKYTQNGSITIGLDKRVEAVRFYVKDTGMGIAPEIMDELFQKFSRGIGGTVNTGGSGLGLYLAKEIVEAHKGKVWAESEGAGKGSTFIAELPLVSK